MNKTILEGNIMIVDNIIKLADILIWPITLLICVILFKGKISEIINLIEKIKFKDFEISLSKDVEKIEEKASNISLPEDITPKEKLLNQELYLLAATSPKESIIASWNKLEKLAEEVVQEYLDPEDGEVNTRAPMYVRWALGTKNLLEVPHLRVYDELKSVRNKLADNKYVAPTESEALAFVDAVKKLTLYLEREKR